MVVGNTTCANQQESFRGTASCCAGDHNLEPQLLFDTPFTNGIFYIVKRIARASLALDASLID